MWTCRCRVAAQQDDRAGHDAAAENPVEFPTPTGKLDR
jgi:hypothetical protein